MKSEPGTYALIFKNEKQVQVQIGQWKKITLCSGYYIYIGSAFGPGGIRARVSRHCRVDKPKRWHLDYISCMAQPVEAWISYATKHLEHEWADVFRNQTPFTPVEGFGCTDCRCLSHLFYSSHRPELKTYQDLLDFPADIRITTPA